MDCRIHTFIHKKVSREIKFLLRKEESAKGMGQSPNDATGSDAQMNLSKEECAGGMERRPNNAVKKDAQIILSEEECAGGMGRRI